MSSEPHRNPLVRHQRILLLLVASVSSACGLAVELLLGTLASYLVGNHALAYGVSVGGFLAAMGLGAYLSRFVKKNLQTAFIAVELLFAPLSALYPMALFGLFVLQGPFWFGLFLATTCLGTLAGMELPLLTRLLEQDESLKDALAGALALDYLGALVGALALPLLLLPMLGLFPAAGLIGIVQAVMVILLGQYLPSLRPWRIWGVMVALGLAVLTPLLTPLGDRLEDKLYAAPIITRLQSPYQRVVLTQQEQDTRLYLDGVLQLSTLDEARYHEPLVHLAMAANQQLLGDNEHERRVLLMGAGDGFALREILKWRDVAEVVLIDLDPVVLELARSQPDLVAGNGRSLQDPRVRVVQGDAFLLAPQLPERFDVMIADFPDPDRDALAKLYTQGFYRRLLTRLQPQGVLVTQASSPVFSPKAFACIAKTLASVDLAVYPYWVDIPSFGTWGFVMAGRSPLEPMAFARSQTEGEGVETRFLTPEIAPQLLAVPADLPFGAVAVNRLSRPILARYESNYRWKS